jgi:hypothetical protein
LARFGERVVEADRRAAEHSEAPLHTTPVTDSYNQALDALEISRLLIPHAHQNFWSWTYCPANRSFGGTRWSHCTMVRADASATL